ncbi:hypothetical protein CRN80_23850 [Pseudomonas sp. FDAARGOS_380]|nr:hypothetical protein CRN80_23850 [Pseudomonas sp. FDAARGOS_380]
MQRQKQQFPGFCMAVYRDGVLIRTDLSAPVFDTDEIPRALLMSHIEANPSASAQLNDPTIEALRKRP